MRRSTPATPLCNPGIELGLSRRIHSWESPEDGGAGCVSG